MNATNIAEYCQTLGVQARAAASQMACASTSVRGNALRRLAALLRANAQALQADNAVDVERASKDGLSAPLLDRLKLSERSIETVAQGCEQLAAMPDVIGEITGLRQQPSGIRVGQMRVPIGVFAMVYESRPSVTIEAASLAIKSGNACILRGGSEAIRSNKALALLVQQALTESGLPADGVQLVQTTDRAVVGQLITMPQYVDMAIPRGGKGLIERISAEAKVPVLKHLDGNCHVYVDDPCDIDMALRIADNAKTQKYSPCNASESLLVARGVAGDFLPRVAAVFAAKGVEMRCDAQTKELLERGMAAGTSVGHQDGLSNSTAVREASVPAPGGSAAPQSIGGLPSHLVTLASEKDWYEEYLAPIISIKIVADVGEAISHINHYGSHHTDAIVTRDHGHAQAFLRQVDSASVMVNASTR
ncbi:MAG: glutamate-5-semialdehyde dehydrogenase, partial [Burkholderiaceae bacterium]